MNAPHGLFWLNAPVWLPLVHALLHTLWQGALAAGGLFLILRFVPTRRAGLRYGLSAAALALVVLTGLGSWALLDAPRHSLASTIRSDHSSNAASGRFGERSAFQAFIIPSASTRTRAAVQQTGVSPTMITADASMARAWVQWVAAGWLLGVFASLLRTIKGTLGAGRLRRCCRDLVDPRVLALAEDLRVRLGVSRRVRFLVCDEVGVPSMLGILYPAVLLPASLLTGVPLEQLRAVLAHELAHIRRWDYLANLAQMLVEALLFFNPFVWWLSRQVRLEREACCDQVAAGECRSPASYVEALVAVVEHNRVNAVVAPPILAASGPDVQGGNTLERARRLLVPGYQPAFRIRWYSLAAVLVLSVFILSGLWLGTRAMAQTIQAAEKNSPKPADNSNAPAAIEGLPNDVLAAAREGNAKQALSSLETSFKPKKFSEEDAAHTLDSLIRARELRAFTTLYDSLKHFYAKNWKLSDDLLAGLVKDGRTDFLDALLVRRFDLNRLTKAGESAEPATAAWIARRVAEVTKQHADIEALEKAATGNDLPAMQRMIDAGADVNGVGKDDNTPLIRAVSRDHLEAAQWLLDHGAQADKPRLPGWNYTPLCLVHSVPMAELLKKYGANPHAKLYERDVSILTYVAMWSKADVVAWFLKQGLDARMIGDNQENLLFGLTDGATAGELLEAGADPNHMDEFGRTPLTAAHSGEVVRALVRHGADLHPKLKDGLTLLEYAAYNTPREDLTPEEDASFIDELIKQGAEFDPKGNGVKALLSAAFSDRVGEVRAFLDHGVSPDAAYMRNANEYRSALSSAAFQAPKSLKLLLERGADPNAPVPKGQFTPLSNALAAGNFNNADLLRQAGAQGIPDLIYYSAKGDLVKVSALLDGQHADPNEVDSSGWTPLRYAVRHAQVETARRLLDHGASVDRFDEWGFSPYTDYALDREMIERDSGQARLQWHLSPQEAKVRLAAFEQLFAQHPPDPTYRDASGRTALHQAVWSRNSISLGLMLSGKPRRFDPNLLDNEGRPPLLLAALSPVVKQTQETITTDRDTAHEAQNIQAYLVDELLKAGARLDLVVADGKTVGELSLAAARDANNAQLVAVLTAALKTPSNPPTAPPAPTPSATPGSPTSAESPKRELVPAASPLRDLADLAPERRDEIWSAAFDAIKTGDLQTIDGFLRRGLDVNVDLTNDCSLLFLAVDDNQLAIVRLLLAHGANVQQKTAWGDLPLKRACWRGYKDIADTLIQAGAPKNGLLYATGMGDVPALEARDQRQPITPTEARDTLAFAVTSGHPNTFEFLWKKLAPLSDADKDKLLSSLYEKVGEWGHPELLPVLETLGATPARDGSRALAKAALGNHPEAAKALLERGVSPDAVPPGWGNFLRNAAGDGRIEIVRVLLDHGANINVQDEQGFTPLSWAAYCGKEDVCLLLLTRSADGRIKDHDGRNSTWHAAAGPHCAEALARMIKAGVSVDEKDARGATILEHMTHFATPQSWKGAFFQKVYSPADIVQFNAGERRVVELLLAAGLTPDGPEGRPVPLIEAMHSQHYAMAQTLVDHGADARRQDKTGNPALYSLIGYARDDAFPLELFKTLVKRSGDLNREITFPGTTPPMKTTYLETLMGSAVEQAAGIASWREAIGILLDAGAVFPGVSDPKVQAMLQTAARGDLAPVREAVRQGVPVSAADGASWDLLSITLAIGDNDGANWLIDHGADVNGHQHWTWNCPLGLAIQRGQADLVEKLLAKGAKLEGVSNGLFMAVKQKNVRIFDALLKAGADPREKSNVSASTGGKTFTPRHSVMLYLCIENGLTDMARTLLDKGAEADPPNLEENRNLAYWAVSYDRPEILQSLLDHGADPLVKDDDKGVSALDLARKSHPKLVPMLEEAAKRRTAPA